jgi:hypothetical protein
MLKGGHRAGINVEIGIKFPQSYGKSTGLQEGAKGCRGQAFAERRHNTTGDKYITRHK